jgi:hypothetical protein
MTREDVDTFEKIKAQLDSLYQEISVLARKSPKDAVNKFKLQFINSTLMQCNNFLGATYVPFVDFKSFSIDDLPTNSDVTFMIAQYIECAEKFRADNIKVEIEFDRTRTWHWKIEGAGHKIETAPPKKLTNK